MQELKREEYLKKHHIKDISLVVASYIDSESVGISYMCTGSGSYILLSKDKSFRNFKKIPVQEEFFLLSDYENILFDKIKKEDNIFYECGLYSCQAIIKKEDSFKYYYKIIYNGYEDILRSFDFPNGNKSYSFYSFVDFQHGFNDVTHPLIEKIKDIKACPLLLNSGDLSAVSADYKEWYWLLDKTDLFKDVLFNSAIGDHEYWADYNIHASLLKEPICYMKVFNNPKNGPKSEINKSYYFLYNNSLFVFINTQDSDTVENENLNEIYVWFKDAINKNKGHFDYLFVYMHKAIYGSFENDTRVRRIMKNNFYKLFDDAKVDIVFSGHDHRYSRSLPLTDEKVCENGTIYLDLGSSGNKRRAYEEEVDKDGLHAKVLKIKEDELALGAICDVENDHVNVKIYDQYGHLQDSLSLNKKER